VSDEGTNDGLVVERPQVLERPAAAGQDRDRRCLVRPTGGDPGRGIALDLAKCADQAGRRRIALDLRGDQDDPRT